MSTPHAFPDTSVDNEELFRLAVLDMQQNRHEEAIGRLKRLIERDPDNANAHCLLGAEHAELAMFDRAAADLQRAISLNPLLAVAHFQLGLIHYVRDDFKLARSHWSPLEHLPESAALDAFSKALLLAASGEFEASLVEIERGLHSNPSSALVRDMHRIKDNVAQRFQKQQLEGKPDASEAGDTQHALLNNYSEVSRNPR